MFWSTCRLMPAGNSNIDWKSIALDRKLKKKFKPGVERGGFVLADGKVVECKNIAADPTSTYQMSDTDLCKYADDAVAIWHTHPDDETLLSVDDHNCFVQWPGYYFGLISEKGVRWFTTKGKALIHA